MNGLMLHCGSHQTELDDVMNSPTPPAEGRHYPVPHAMLIQQAKKTIERSGFTISEESHALSTDGFKYFGLLALESDNPEYDTVMGLRNSHDKSFAASLVMGNRVFVCDNLAFSGEVKLSRKHTANIQADLPSLVARAFGSLNDKRFEMDNRIAWYKEQEFGDTQVHDFLIRSVDAKIISNSKVPSVLKEWREPSHECFAERSAWSLFNAFTEVQKGTNLFNRPRTQQALFGLLDTDTGFSGVTSHKEGDILVEV